MKLKFGNESKVRLAGPEVRLTETEILADLNYPGPAKTDTESRGYDLGPDRSH